MLGEDAASSSNGIPDFLRTVLAPSSTVNRARRTSTC